MSESEQLALAIEVFLDAALHLAEGKDDDDIMFVESFFRALASELDIDVTWLEMEPMTAGQFRERWRNAKQRLAEGASVETPAP